MTNICMAIFNCGVKRPNGLVFIARESLFQFLEIAGPVKIKTLRVRYAQGTNELKLAGGFYSFSYDAGSHATGAFHGSQKARGIDARTIGRQQAAIDFNDLRPYDAEQAQVCMANA